MWKNGLIKRLGLVSKFMKPETEQQIVTIQVLSNISRSKDTQTMKIGQLIEYTMRKNFFRSYTRNMVEKLALDPFIKNQIEHIS